MIDLNKKYGSRLCAVISSENPHLAVLVFPDRNEIHSMQVSVGDKRYPILALEQPPEFCGIRDECNLSAQKKDELLTDFCQALVYGTKQGIKTYLINDPHHAWQSSKYCDYQSNFQVMHFAEAPQYFHFVPGRKN